MMRWWVLCWIVLSCLSWTLAESSTAQLTREKALGSKNAHVHPSERLAVKSSKDSNKSKGSKGSKHGGKDSNKKPVPNRTHPDHSKKRHGGHDGGKHKGHKGPKPTPSPHKKPHPKPHPNPHPHKPSHAPPPPKPTHHSRPPTPTPTPSPSPSPSPSPAPEPAPRLPVPDCTNPNSKWDKHFCESKSFNLTAGCMPYRVEHAANSTHQGAMIMFHGFSACPDALRFIAAEMSREGWDVFVPVYPGHGRPVSECETDPHADCVHGQPLSHLPTDYQGYIDFATYVVAMAFESNRFNYPDTLSNLQVASLGLSLGGNLALYSAYLPIVSKILIVDPFWSANVPGLDMQFVKCKAKGGVGCLANYIDTLLNGKPTPATDHAHIAMHLVGDVMSKIKHWAMKGLEGTMAAILMVWYTGFRNTFDNFAVNTVQRKWFGKIFKGILDKPYGWGAACEAQPERNGLCNFRTRHLFAVVAAGFYSGSRTYHISGKQIGFIQTARDGPMRMGISYASASAMAGSNRAAMCMYHGEPGADPSVLSDPTSNVAGMPHSCFSHEEAKSIAPHDLWWEASLFDQVRRFFRDGPEALGTNATDKASCTRLDLNQRNKYTASGVMVEGESHLKNAAKRYQY